jgi:hypothetical protein
MARRTIVELIDDLDHKPIKPGGGETLTFGLENVEYTIDLSKANADRLRRAMAPYVSAARPLDGNRSTRRTPSEWQRTRGYDPKAVRKWAESHRLDVPARGRIPASIVAQFHAAGN